MAKLTKLILIKTGIRLKNVSTKSQIFEAYNKIINLKTASLFSSPCKGVALQADMPVDVLKVFEECGREIGLAYQLADDLVDLAKGEFIDSVILPIVNRIEKQTTELSDLCGAGGRSSGPRDGRRGDRGRRTGAGD